jgi:hypothetical protein
MHGHIQPNFSNPASVLGFNLPIGIPVINESGRETAMIVIAHVEFDSNGEQRVVFPDETRKRIKALGAKYEDALFRYMSGIAKATHNTACKIARERWETISRNSK